MAAGGRKGSSPPGMCGGVLTRLVVTRCRRLPSVTTNWRSLAGQATRGPRVAAGEEELEPEGGLRRDLQRALTAAKKADQKARKIQETITTRREQWGLYEKQMKNAFNAQKKQFDQDIKRMEKDLEAAHSAGQQAIADFTTEVQELMSGTRSAPQADASERAWDDLIGGPDMEVEPAGYYAEALALAGRAGRRMSGLEANMIRLQQEANLAASRAPPAPGPPPGLNPEPVRAAPPSMPPPVPPPEVYAAEAHRDPYLTSPSTRAPPGGSPAVTRSRTPRQSSRPRSHPYGQAEIPSDADLEARLRARRAAPDAPAGFMQEHGASGPGNGGALPSAGAGIALRPFGRPLAPEGRNLLAGARIEEDDDEDLAEEELNSGHPLGTG